MNRIVAEASGLIDDLRHANRVSSDTRAVWHLPKCLLVEDDENDILLSKTALELLRIHVSVAKSKDEAIDRLNETNLGSKRSFDMMFLDLKLHGSVQAGLDVMEYAKVNFPWVHIVLVSAYITQDVLDAARQQKTVGGSYMGFVNKPLMREDIMEICGKHRIPIANLTA